MINNKVNSKNEVTFPDLMKFLLVSKSVTKLRLIINSKNFATCFLFCLKCILLLVGYLLGFQFNNIILLTGFEVNSGTNCPRFF